MGLYGVGSFLFKVIKCVGGAGFLEDPMACNTLQQPNTGPSLVGSIEKLGQSISGLAQGVANLFRVGRPQCIGDVPPPRGWDGTGTGFV